MSLLTRKLRYAAWALNGRFGRRSHLAIPQKATVLITYFNPARMEHAEPQIRNVLKCNFVEKVLVSNHNPAVCIEDVVKVRAKRLQFMNQPVPRGCGYRWTVASAIDPEYLILVDDDVLLFPAQIAQLFACLVNEPHVPHGFAGMLHPEWDVFEYHERKEMDVDYLCETYAVTRSHLKRYAEIERFLTVDRNVAKMIDSTADFMLISQSGTARPKIHNLGRLLRSETFNKEGVAVHKDEAFDNILLTVSKALEALP